MNNNLRYIIMCGGTYPHWETPRQLSIVHGEPLVARTIRLLRENGISDIAITAQDERFNQFGVPVLHHDNKYIYGKDRIEDHSYWVDAFYPSDEPICYLMGDVFFSRNAIETIVGYEQGEDVKNLAYKYLDNIDVYVEKDYSDKDRFVFIVSKETVHKLHT